MWIHLVLFLYIILGVLGPKKKKNYLCWVNKQSWKTAASLTKSLSMGQMLMQFFPLSEYLYDNVSNNQILEGFEGCAIFLGQSR